MCLCPSDGHVAPLGLFCLLYMAVLCELWPLAVGTSVTVDGWGNPGEPLSCRGESFPHSASPPPGPWLGEMCISVCPCVFVMACAHKRACVSVAVSARVHTCIRACCLSVHMHTGVYLCACLCLHAGQSVYVLGALLSQCRGWAASAASRAVAFPQLHKHRPSCPLKQGGRPVALWPVARDGGKPFAPLLGWSLHFSNARSRVL